MICCWCGTWWRPLGNPLRVILCLVLRPRICLVNIHSLVEYLFGMVRIRRNYLGVPWWHWPCGTGRRYQLLLLFEIMWRICWRRLLGVHMPGCMITLAVISWGSRRGATGVLYIEGLVGDFLRCFWVIALQHKQMKNDFKHFVSCKQLAYGNKMLHYTYRDNCSGPTSDASILTAMFQLYGFPASRMICIMFSDMLWHSTLCFTCLLE